MIPRHASCAHRACRPSGSGRRQPEHDSSPRNVSLKVPGVLIQGGAQHRHERRNQRSVVLNVHRASSRWLEIPPPTTMADCGGLGSPVSSDRRSSPPHLTEGSRYGTGGASQSLITPPIQVRVDPWSTSRRSRRSASSRLSPWLHTAVEGRTNCVGRNGVHRHGQDTRRRTATSSTVGDRSVHAPIHRVDRISLGRQLRLEGDGTRSKA